MMDKLVRGQLWAALAVLPAVVLGLGGCAAQPPDQPVTRPASSPASSPTTEGQAPSEAASTPSDEPSASASPAATEPGAPGTDAPSPTNQAAPGQGATPRASLAAAGDGNETQAVTVARPSHQADAAATSPGSGPGVQVQSAKTNGIGYPVVSGGAEQERINQAIAAEVARVRQTYPGEHLSVTYRVVKNAGGVLSIVFSGLASDASAAHPSNVFAALSIDTATGAPLTLGGYAVVDAAFIRTARAAFDAKLAGAGATLTGIYPAGELPGLLRQADLPSGGILPTFQSYVTDAGLTLSVSVPHTIGDHIEVALAANQFTRR